MTPSGSAGGCCQTCCGCVFLFGAGSCFNVAGVASRDASNFFVASQIPKSGNFRLFWEWQEQGTGAEHLLYNVLKKKKSLEALSYASRCLGFDCRKILMKKWGELLLWWELQRK